MVSTRIYSMLVAACVTIFTLLTLFFIFAAETDADEGLFLYAGHLVYEGKLPYRDFQFPQMPLAPYVYGAPQLIFGHSLYVGRLTTALLLVTTFVVTVMSARLLAGPGSAIWIALLLGTNRWFVFFGTIIRTHPLVFLLIALSVYVCAKEIHVPRESEREKALLLILGTVLGGAVVLTRLPSIGFAAVLFVYTSFRTAQLGRRWIVLNVLAAGMVAGVAAAFAIAAGWDVFWFNNVGFHWLYHEEGIQAGSGPLRSGVWLLNAASLLRDLLDTHSRVFPIELFVIACAVVGYGWLAGRRSDATVERQTHQLMLAVALGTCILAVSPIVQDPQHTEYAAIILPSAALVIATAFSKLGRGSPMGLVGLDKAKPGQWFLVLFVFISAYQLSRYSVPAIREVGVVRVNGAVKLPLSYVREIASVLRDNKRADGTVLTNYPSLAHVAGLPLMARLEMAVSACQELSDSVAERYKNVNLELVTSMILGNQAEYVIVSKGREPIEFNNCEWTPEAAASTRRHLEQYYQVLAEFDDFGEHGDDIVVFQRRADTEG